MSRNASAGTGRGAKIIMAGHLSQLQAVGNGGMSLLATRLGYARLAEPVRFRNPWEQHASLRLRDGDPEQMMDAAAAAYVALAASGTDTLLMAADHALRHLLDRLDELTSGQAGPWRVREPGSKPPLYGRPLECRNAS